MMVKRGITTDSEETCAKVVFEPTDTIYDVYRKMNAAVEEIRVLRRQRHRERGPHPDWASPAWSSSWPSR